MSESPLPTTTTTGRTKDDDGLIELSAGQSLELEDLKFFDWGDRESNVNEDRLFVNGGGESGTHSGSSTSHQQSASVADDDKWGPLPFNGYDSQGLSSSYGFAGHNYWGGFRSWGGNGGGFGNDDTASPSSPVMIATPLPMADDDDSEPPPGMVSSSDASDGDETMSSAGSSILDDVSSAAGSRCSSSSSSRGVTFNEQVRVLPIPPISSYSVEQRRRMYANRFELRENKVRNKREYEFDGYDWRNATEEGSMAICPLSGELLHPAHL
mmetsp:Transcript_8826/g.21438  ORF Transcript_8826/g.21438 Transcript_8826/m.21438 type:complete len:268 (+) Transcript_8826:150-953(+)|eukprot:CAMPEP_0181120278 /NCGR_PEP_ID=MMETSP1071-20121207/24070_1 /TAXON_ID=35127 /ORGANISM="Thalassiosira sp., Strain NH16" /LENGTH=267 /DNA_ID=CAMNT_0023204921 /DNA_START=64 /DNA_END=867 /DNA_ORIENTATION=-